MTTPSELNRRDRLRRWVTLETTSGVLLLIAAVLALTALGLSLQFGVMRIVNVAHGEFFMLGAMLAFWFSRLVPGSPAAGADQAAASQFAIAARDFTSTMPMLAELRVMKTPAWLG